MAHRCGESGHASSHGIERKAEQSVAERPRPSGSYKPKTYRGSSFPGCSFLAGSGLAGPALILGIFVIFLEDKPPPRSGRQDSPTALAADGGRVERVPALSGRWEGEIGGKGNGNTNWSLKFTMAASFERAGLVGRVTEFGARGPNSLSYADVRGSIYGNRVTFVQDYGGGPKSRLEVDGVLDHQGRVFEGKWQNFGLRSDGFYRMRWRSAN